MAIGAARKRKLFSIIPATDKLAPSTSYLHRSVLGEQTTQARDPRPRRGSFRGVNLIKAPGASAATS